jgi:CBS domain containing-hemolysin-like protein
MMVEEASSQGVLAEEEKEMIHSVIELSDTIAREIMIPRLDIVAVEVNTPLTKVLDAAITHGLSRLPVFEETVDKVIGIVHTKDLLSLLREKKMDTPLKDNIRHAYFTPGSKKIDEMLREMQREKVAMAIVVDEYGGTDGLVTIEDIIEEIVGDITDEYDKEINSIELMDDGSYMVDAKTNIEDVNAELHIDLPTDEFETLAGYVYGLTGHIPHNGETIKADNITITVEKVIRQRISRVKILKEDKIPVQAENA